MANPVSTANTDTVSETPSAEQQLIDNYKNLLIEKSAVDKKLVKVTSLENKLSLYALDLIAILNSFESSIMPLEDSESIDSVNANKYVAQLVDELEKSLGEKYIFQIDRNENGAPIYITVGFNDETNLSDIFNTAVTTIQEELNVQIPNINELGFKEITTNSSETYDALDLSLGYKTSATKYVEFTTNLPAKSVIDDEALNILIHGDTNRLPLGNILSFVVTIKKDNTTVTKVVIDPTSLVIDEKTNNFSFELPKFTANLKDMRSYNFEVSIISNNNTAESRFNETKFTKTFGIQNKLGDYSFENTTFSLEADNATQNFGTSIVSPENNEENIFADAPVYATINYANNGGVDSDLLEVENGTLSHKLLTNQQPEKITLYWMDKHSNLVTKEIKMPVIFNKGLIINSLNLINDQKEFTLDLDSNSTESKLLGTDEVSFNKALEISSNTIFNSSILKQGKQKIVFGSDDKNNINDFTYEVYVDTTPLTGLIKLSNIPAITNGDTIYISGKDAANFIIELDKSTATGTATFTNTEDSADTITKDISVTDKTFELKCSELTDNAKYKAEVNLKDMSHNPLSFNFDLVNDVNEPELSTALANESAVYSKDEDTWFLKSSVPSIAFGISDNMDEELKIIVTQGQDLLPPTNDIVPYTVKDNKIEFTPIEHNVNIPVTVELIDDSGNKSTSTLNLFKDTVSPEIGGINDGAILKDDVYYLIDGNNKMSLEIIEEGSKINATRFSATINEVDFSKDNISYEDGVLTLSNIPRNTDTTPLPITISGYDYAGNELTWESKIHNDSSKPFISVKPLDKKTVSEGTASDGYFKPESYFFIDKDATEVEFEIRVDDDGLLGDIVEDIKKVNVFITDENGKSTKIKSQFSLFNTSKNKKYTFISKDFVDGEYTLTVSVTDVNNNNIESNFTIVKNTKSLSTENEYGTDRINIKLENTGVQEYNNNFHDISGNNKPANNKINVIELANKLPEDKLDLIISKANMNKGEKISVNYTIKNSLGSIVTTGSISNNKNDTTATIKDLPLSTGVNIIEYTLLSNNNETITKFVEVHYDPTNLDISVDNTSNLTGIDKDGLKYYDNFSSVITVNDTNISEITSITLKGVYSNKEIKNEEFSHDFKLENIKVDDTNSYKIELPTSELKEGKYDNVIIEVTSNFGERKGTTTTKLAEDSFVIDNTTPSIPTLESNKTETEDGKLINDVWYPNKPDSNTISFQVADSSIGVIDATKHLDVTVTDSILGAIDANLESGLTYTFDSNGKLTFKNLPTDSNINLTIDIADPLGHTVSYSIIICNDVSVPELASTNTDTETEGAQKLDDTWYLKDGKNTISFNLTDNASGVAAESLDVSYTYEGTTGKIGHEFNDGKLTLNDIPATTDSKLLNVTIAVADKAGNSTEFKMTIYNDITAPVVVVKAVSGINETLGVVNLQNTEYQNAGSEFYTAYNTNEIGFEVLATDDGIIVNELLVELLNNNGESVKTLSPSVAKATTNFKQQYYTDINGLANGLYTLRVTTKDINNNKDNNTTKPYEYVVAINNINIADLTNENNNVYGSNHINIGLTSTGVDNYNKSFHEFEGTNKPLNSDKFSPIIELANKITNDKIDVTLSKFENKPFEKTTIEYSINGQPQKPLTYVHGNIVESLVSSPINVDLINGVNTIEYTVISTNGTKFNKTLEVHYDPNDLTIDIKNDSADLNSSYYYNQSIVEPTLTITDKFMSELDGDNSIFVKILRNDKIEYLTLNKSDFTQSVKVTENRIEETIYSYKFNNLDDSKYTLLDVEIVSNFGERKGTHKLSDKIDFIVDRKTPDVKLAVNSTPENSKSALDVLSSGSYYNTNEIKVLMMNESLDNNTATSSDTNRYNATVSPENIKVQIVQTLENGKENIFYGNFEEDATVKNTLSIKHSSNELNGYSYGISHNTDTSKLYAEGSYKVNVWITDAAGNEGKLAETTYTIDKTLPKITASVNDIINNVTKDVTATEYHVNTNAVIFKIDEKYFNNQSTATKFNSNIQEDLASTGAAVNGAITTNSINIVNEGVYEFVVTAADKAGNTKTETFRVTLDNKNPEIDINKLASNLNPVYATNTPSILLGVNGQSNDKTRDITMADTMNAIHKVEVTVTEDGASSPAYKRTLDNLSNIPELNLSEGKYTISLVAIDKASNRSSEVTGRLVVDTEGPKISINAGGSVNNVHHSVQSISPIITIDDVTTTREHLKFRINGKEVTPTSVDTSYKKLVATLPTMTAEDIYDLEVSAGDRVVFKENVAPQGNTNRSASNSAFNFAIDRTAPSINVNFGKNTGIANSINYLNASDSNKSIIATIKDTILDRISDESVKISTVITPENSGSTSILGTSYAFGADNTYKVVITATDKAGNESRYETTVIVDTVFPKIEFQGIKEGQHSNKDLLPKWKIDDISAGFTATLNGKPFTGTKITEEGKYVLVLTAKDTAGNVTELKFNFVVDKTNPVVNIMDLISNSQIEGNKVYLDGLKPYITWDDPETITTILLNGAGYVGEEIDENGNYTLYIKGVDKAGNIFETTLNFRVNKDRPVIIPTSFEDGKVYTDPVKLEFNFKGAIKTEIYVNGKLYNGEEISAGGDYKVKVIATNEDGGQTIEEFTFKIAKKQFSIFGMNPVQSSLFAGGSVALLLLAALFVAMKGKKTAKPTTKKDEE